MPQTQPLKSLALPLALVSWVALLLTTLLRANPTLLAVQLPAWLTLLAQGVFVGSVFLHQRYQPDPLRGTDFVGVLRRLIMGPGLLASICVGLHLLERLLQFQLGIADRTLFAIIYTLNLGLFVLFLAHTCYTWRSLVLFRASPTVHKQWAWFEVLLGSTLLLRLVNLQLPLLAAGIILGALGVFGAYLSSHQRWVAYLNRRQKWEVILLQLGVLLALGVFTIYFLRIRHDPQLVAPQPQHAFLLLTVFFAAFYALMGLLVTLFNLPTAGVFEQKREEIMTMQRLTQQIQRGQSEVEIYTSFFDAARQTVNAEAAWLRINSLEGEPYSRLEVVTEAQSLAMEGLLKDYNISGIEYLNNDLPSSSGFRALDLPFGSLLVLPLRSAKHTYGDLYLLRQTRQGFDRESLSMLQTFASQTILSIENLRLLQDSIQNERYKEELKIASSVQESLIPKTLPTDNWFEISSHALAAKEVGGDFYDFLHLPGKGLAILIGDVSGKGITAAFHMAQMKGIFHALMQENPLAKDEKERFPLPSKFMAMANRALVHCLERSSFITATLYIVEYESGGFVFARAGHCHTLYYHSLKEEVAFFRSAGLGLGIIRNETYDKYIKNQFYDYNPGDVMVIYTDGIVEARNAEQEEYGEERLRQMLEKTYYLQADEIKEAILEDLGEFSYGQPIHDDQTLLVIKFKTAQPGTHP
ncbi:PP2C family protein-serine/threonine phosphatase [Hymenobacter sp. DG25B]|jgi:serine phosphatase RsbU (regulator of sigma subunit)|uniref:PP2C family protein-serine/threonine phosphatase n=1 Tax=Hymenobacter sp. DG25B TaxID=1385664 RepID=UPI0009E2A770|nr:SpoIIE family protein phosphatase [Hymenobacter sp. DG25B]